MTDQPDAYTLAARAAADRARAEAIAQQGGVHAVPRVGNPIAKFEKVPGLRWVRTHWLGIAAAVVVLPLFGVMAWVRNSEAEYSATGQQGALWGHPGAWLPVWLGGHPMAANQPTLITDDKEYAALIHDYPELALKTGDPPEIRGIKIGAINAHWKARLQAEQDAATAMEKASITARPEAEAELLVRNQAKADVIEDADEAWQRDQAERTTHLGDDHYNAPAGLRYQALNAELGQRMDSGVVVPTFEQRNIILRYGALEAELAAPSTPLPSGSTITSYYIQKTKGNKSLATLPDQAGNPEYVLFRAEQIGWGAMTLPEWRKLVKPNSVLARHN